MGNLSGSLTLFATNILVCAALYLLRHSANDSTMRTVYLLAANGVAGLVGFLPFRDENAVKLDRPTLAVVAWSACYCAEYGLFLVYPGVVSISQLIVCNSLAPFLAVYLSRDVQRSKLSAGYRLAFIAPIIFLLGIAYMERQSSVPSNRNAALLLLCILLLSGTISQACARYVARNRSPGWSQPRLTLLNAIFLGLILSAFSHAAADMVWRSINLGLIILTGALIFAIQRFYVFGLAKADPFISAMTLCSIVPLSLETEVLFEHRPVNLTEIVLTVGYVVATAVSVKMSTRESGMLRTAQTS